MDASVLLPIITAMLKDGSPSSLIEKVILFGVAWYMVRKELRKQFEGVTSSIKQVSDTLERVETAHALRIQKLESDVQIIKDKI